MGWDSTKHPRGPGGRFVKVGSALGMGKHEGKGGKSLGREPSSPLSGLALKMSGKGKAPSTPKAPKAAKEAPSTPKASGSKAGLGKVAAKMGGAPKPSKAPKASKAPESRDAAIERHVRDVVANNSNPEWTDMADVRDRLDAQGYSRDEQDRVLKHMLRDTSDVRIIPIADRKTLHPRDHQAALRIGVEDHHVIQIKPGANHDYQFRQQEAAKAAGPVRGAKFLASDWTSQPSKGPLARATGATPGKAAGGASDDLAGLSARQLRSLAKQEDIPIGPKDTRAQIANHIRANRHRRTAQGAGARHISGR